MRKGLFFFSIVSMLFVQSATAGGTIELEYLAYSHKTLPIERLYFLSTDYAVGVGSSKGQKDTPIYLLDRHNLVQDTFMVKEEPLSVIISNDSTLYIQESKKTLELLIRDDRLLLKNQLTVRDQNQSNPGKILNEPLFLGTVVIGKTFESNKAYRSKEYCLNLMEVDLDNSSLNGKQVKLLEAQGPCRKSTDLDYALSNNDLMVFQNSSCRLLEVDLENESVKEEIALSDADDWDFFYDHISKKKYLVKVPKARKEKVELYLLGNQNQLILKESLDEIPFGIVDNRIHTVKKEKDQYFHLLIPFSSEDELERNNFLQEVQIMAK